MYGHGEGLVTDGLAQGKGPEIIITHLTPHRGEGHSDPGQLAVFGGVRDKILWPEIKLLDRDKMSKLTKAKKRQPTIIPIDSEDKKGLSPEPPQDHDEGVGVADYSRVRLVV